MTTPASSYKLPLPQPDEETKGYWDAARKHQLVVQTCNSCGALRFPPRPVCSKCYSEGSTWKPVSGRGTIFSYIIIQQATIPAFQELAPYNVVQVSLEEDPAVILTGNVVGTDNAKLRVGLPVSVFFDDVTAEDSLPRWKLR